MLKRPSIAECIVTEDAALAKKFLDEVRNEGLDSRIADRCTLMRRDPSLIRSRRFSCPVFHAASHAPFFTPFLAPTGGRCLRLPQYFHALR
jgi:hypothetical protein